MVEFIEEFARRYRWGAQVWARWLYRRLGHDARVAGADGAAIYGHWPLEVCTHVGFGEWRLDTIEARVIQPLVISTKVGFARNNAPVNVLLAPSAPCLPSPSGHRSDNKLGPCLPTTDRSDNRDPGNQIFHRDHYPCRRSILCLYQHNTSRQAHSDPR